MKPGRCAAILLAAGVSRRMGRFKPLLPLGETTVAGRVISVFRQHGVDVYLVVGWWGDELRTAVGEQVDAVIENPDYENGMFTSVRAGVANLPPDYKAFFVMPVDIPLVRPATIVRLLSEAETNPGKIIYPVFGAKRGHPPLIPRELAPDILGWTGDGGLKAALAALDSGAVEVNVPDGNILLDMDTEEDYRAMLGRWQRYGVPTDDECRVILDGARPAPNIRRHCERVAGVAEAIAIGLRGAGCDIDLETVRAAAMLHDIVRKQPHHDVAGARLLRRLGFDTVADIVAQHSDIPEGADVSLETGVVFLADKFVQDTDTVSLEERYEAACRKYGSTPEIVAGIKQLESRARKVKRELEGRLGYALEGLVFRGESPERD